MNDGFAFIIFKTKADDGKIKRLIGNMETRLTALTSAKRRTKINITTIGRRGRLGVFSWRRRMKRSNVVARDATEQYNVQGQKDR